MNAEAWEEIPYLLYIYIIAQNMPICQASLKTTPPPNKKSSCSRRLPKGKWHVGEEGRIPTTHHLDKKPFFCYPFPMKWLISLALQVVLNATILFAANRIIPGVAIEESILILLLAGFLLWVGNAIVRPVVTLLALPLMVLTLGLFHFVITAFILWGIDIVLPQLSIAGIVPLFLLTLFVSVVGALFSFVK